MYADWPLLQPKLLEQALREFSANPESKDISKYENPNDPDALPEPLPLAYKEMFRAITMGCKTVCGGISRERIESLLEQGMLVQTSIKTRILYPDSRASYHSVLIYGLDNEKVVYHDPARQPAMTCRIDTILKAANGTGAFMAFGTTSQTPQAASHN